MRREQAPQSLENLEVIKEQELLVEKIGHYVRRANKSKPLRPSSTSGATISPGHWIYTTAVPHHWTEKQSMNAQEHQELHKLSCSKVMQ